MLTCIITILFTVVFLDGPGPHQEPFSELVDGPRYYFYIISPFTADQWDIHDMGDCNLDTPEVVFIVVISTGDPWKLKAELKSMTRNLNDISFISKYTVASRDY